MNAVHRGASVQVVLCTDVMYSTCIISIHSLYQTMMKMYKVLSFIGPLHTSVFEEVEHARYMRMASHTVTDE